jgi:serine/threonine-protein kinase
MNQTRWRQVEEIYYAALELPVNERFQYLSNASNGDKDLYGEVFSLLSSHDKTDDFLSQSYFELGLNVLAIPSQSLQIQQSFGNYKILKFLGRGGMGEVYLAQDLRLGRRVALKLLQRSNSTDSDRIRRFKQEARTASLINHPNVAQVFEIGEVEDKHFIALEFVDGKTIRELLKEDLIDIFQILGIANEIAKALNAAHKVGVAHRDLKPENVMLRDDGTVKVLDFSLAKLTQGFSSSVQNSSSEFSHTTFNTEPGFLMGTVNYMSPEQVRGQDVDLRTDLWSFGVLIYEMFAGKLPFIGQTSGDTIAEILKSEPTPLSDLIDNIPSKVELITLKCLEKEREYRYQSSQELLSDLSNLLQDLNYSEYSDNSIPSVNRENEAVKTNINRISRRDTDKSFRQITQDQDGNSSLSFPNLTKSFGQINQNKKVGISVLIIFICCLTAISYFGYLYYQPSLTINSIAVLPFVNDSGNSENEYLSDGMTESLISRLSQIPKLNVKARSSVFRYKGKETDLQKIAQELNVQAILNGRIVQRGGQLILNLELVDTKTENVIWNQQYARKQTDLVSLQSEVVNEVLNKLRTTMTGGTEQKLTKSYTENPEAYRLYLKGRFYWNKRTVKDLQKSIEYFQQAVDLDPNYALAYSGLADAYALFSGYGGGDPQELILKARETALKALTIDPNLAEAHASLGLILHDYDYDFIGAEREIKLAIELNPNYPTARQFYGEILIELGRFEEGFAEFRRALEIDPLSLKINQEFGTRLFLARKYDESLEQLNKTLELDSNFVPTHYSLYLVHFAKGNYQQSIEEFAKLKELGGDHRNAALGRESFANGGWRGFLEFMTRERRPVGSSAYTLATYHAALGEKDKAFEELYKSFEKRESVVPFIKIDPRLDPLRDDPRFNDLMKRVGFTNSN